MTGTLAFTTQSFRTCGRTKFTYVFPRFDSYRSSLEENQNSRILTSKKVKELSPSQPATEDLPHRAGIAPIRASESLVVEDWNEDLHATPLAILESGLPPAYYRIIMEAPLTSYQRTFLIQAMTAVTANKNRDSPKEEPEDSTGGEDEGGVPLSREELGNRGLTGNAGAISPIEW